MALLPCKHLSDGSGILSWTGSIFTVCNTTMVSCLTVFTHPCVNFFHACDFSGGSLCQTCSGRLCSTCKLSLKQLHGDILRDRVVTGVLNDATHHKLLATADLSLEVAVKTCHAEETATNTTSHIPRTCQANVARKSTYQRQKFVVPDQPPSKSAPSTGESAQPATPVLPKCPNCGRAKPTKSPCPAHGRTCTRCKTVGHFQSVCPQNSRQSARSNHIGQLKLQRAAASPSCTVVVETQLSTDP